MSEIRRWYPPEKFARNQSYPAFGNSSIDDDLGTGEIEVTDGGRTQRVLKDDNGALAGGINLGFVWKDVVDQSDTWSMALANELAQNEMTVDVTPRRCQRFKLRSGETVTWTSTAGGKGTVTADKWGLVTVTGVSIAPGKNTVLTIKKHVSPNE